MTTLSEANGHVEITSGIIISETIEDAQDKRPVLDRVGTRVFQVESIDADGWRVVLWDGASYEQAIIEAEALAREGFGPVLDRVI